MKPKTLIIVGVTACGLLLGIVLAANASFGSYLKSAPFRRLLEQAAGNASRAEASIAPLTWNGSAAYSETARISGSPSSLVRTMEARQVRAEVDWRAVFGGAWRVDSLTITQLTGEFQPPIAAEPREAHDVAAFSAWLPKRLDLARVEISDVDLSYGSARLSGSRVELHPESVGWLISGTGGKLQIGTVPQMTVQSFEVRAQRDVVFLTKSDLRLGANGKLNLRGDSTPLGNLQLSWEAVDSKDFFPPFLQAYLSGTAGGQADMRSDGQVRGTMDLKEGLLQNVPLLDLLADFSGNPGFRRMPLQELRFHFTRMGEVITITDLVAQSKGLLRLEGTLRITKGSAINGTFQIGVTPQTLQWLPGSRERVFNTARDGYLWTSLQIGGTLDQPSEDLSPRLVSAMGQAVIDKGTQLLNGNPTPATDAVKDVLNLLSPLLR